MFFRAELRRRWRAWLALALIVGAFAGVVEAAAAGARRTDAAYPSLLAWSRAPDVLVFSFPDASRTFAQFSPREVAAIPQARQAAILAGYPVASPAAAQVIAPESTVVPSRFWRRRILAGRLPDPARPDEADISFTLAQTAHLGVGDVLRVDAADSGRPVGTVRVPDRRDRRGPLRVPAADRDGHRHGLGDPGLLPGAPLRPRQLHGGSPPAPAWECRPARRPARDQPAGTGGKYVQSYPLATQAANTERSIHLQAVALWLVAALLAVISVLVLGQLLARMSFLDSVEYRTLRALGLSRRTLLAIGLLRAAVIGAAGAVAGTADRAGHLPAAARRPGRSGRALPGNPRRWPRLRRRGGRRGADHDRRDRLADLAGGERRTVGGRPGPPGPGQPGGRRRPQFLATLTSGIGSVTAMLGIRLALQPGAGRTAVPVRSTVASAVVGVAALTGALVFSASLGHLLATPRLYGVTWDAYVSNTQQHGVEAAIRGLTGRPGVTAWSAGYSGVPLTVQGVPTDAIAMLPSHHGDLLPVPVRGRLPRGPDEITVGEKTLAAMHARIGQTVAVSLDGFRPGPYRIVGTAVFPNISDSLSLGRGATLSVAGLRRLLPPSLSTPPLDTLLVRFRPGAGGPAGLNALAARAARLGPFVVQGPTTPTDVVNFGRVQSLPLLLGMALSLLALITIVHLLLTSVRRRRRDFAVLRSIGLTRRQVRSTISWQASTLTAVALGLGIPLGIVCGRVAWRLFAGQLGIMPVVVLPVMLVLVVPAALALAVAVAAVPGESAARARPAEILRSE